MNASTPPLPGSAGSIPLRPQAQMRQMTQLTQETHKPQKPHKPRRPWRSTAVIWLRRTHGWFGLWGATLGLLFGFSGIWLNHRAVLKLPPVSQQRSTVQIALPDPPPADPQALAAWLQVALKIDRPPNAIRVEPGQRVGWAEPAADKVADAGTDRLDPTHRADRTARNTAPLMQPARWTILFGGPGTNLQVEAWAGNRSVTVRQVDQGVLGTLMNLHKGVGMPVAWILLVDTLAGCMILLSVSGLALWAMTTRRRAVGLTIFGSSVALVLGVVATRL